MIYRLIDACRAELIAAARHVDPACNSPLGGSVDLVGERQQALADGPGANQA